MQVRPYPNDDTNRRVWLSKSEQDRLVAACDDPEHKIAVRLGLNGLRAAEILRVSHEDIRPLDGHDQLQFLHVDAKDTDGQDRRRDVPIRDDLARAVEYQLGDGFSVTTTKTLREWVGGAADRVADETGRDEWGHVSPHDLRRTGATDLFYSLALNGVPNAESLTMSWGGWKQTESGRATFRERYLGPVPERVWADALETAGWA